MVGVSYVSHIQGRSRVGRGGGQLFCSTRERQTIVTFENEYLSLFILLNLDIEVVFVHIIIRYSIHML